jgi:exonuclease SbcD
MIKIKFIHTADLHLDTPFKGLSSWNNDLASKLKDATFKSFKRIIDLCIQEKVDFLIISGDIFDSENKSLAAQIKFVSELKRLSEKGIPTYFICGNHDPLSSWLDELQLPENVFRFNSSDVENVIYQKDNRPIADIYGISFQNRIVNINLANNYQLNSNPSPISIAILHGTIGAPGPHESYAPFKVEDVVNKGFDYWALGHIHKRHTVHESNPTIVYPGNPQGRDFGETGAKGCYVVEINKDNTPEFKFVSTQLLRFEEVYIDLTEEDKIDKLPDRIEDNIEDYDENTSYILRITLKGRTTLHSQLNKPGEIDQLLEHFNEGQLNQTNFTWIDRIEVKTRPDIDIEQVKKRADFPAELLKTIEEYENNAEKLKELIKNTDEDLSSPQTKRELTELSEHERKGILEKAKCMLLDELIKE